MVRNRFYVTICAIRPFVFVRAFSPARERRGGPCYELWGSLAFPQRSWEDVERHEAARPALDRWGARFHSPFFPWHSSFLPLFHTHREEKQVFCFLLLVYLQFLSSPHAMSAGPGAAYLHPRHDEVDDPSSSFSIFFSSSSYLLADVWWVFFFSFSTFNEAAQTNPASLQSSPFITPKIK